MARVPTYDVPQETARALPGAQQQTIASPAMFSAAGREQVRFGQAVSDAGTAVLAVQKRLQDQRDADVLFSNEAAVTEEYLKHENSVRERRGQNAWGVTEETTKWWDDTGRKYSDKLENDKQRRLFDQTVTKLRLRSLDGVSKHEAAERRRSLDESANASIVGSINLAAANHTNPEILSGAKLDITKRAQVRSQLNGDAPEVAAGKLTEYLTNFHQQVIQNRVNTDPAGAQAYYEANKAEIAGTSHETIEKVLKIGTVKEKAQTFADEAVKNGLSEPAALAEARKQFKGDDEIAAVAEIKTRFSEQTQIRERVQKDAADNAWKIYARDGSLSNVPAKVLAQMDGQALTALRKEASGANVETNWEKYYDLRQRAITDPSGFSRVDLRTQFPHLGKREREALIDLQAAVQRADDQRDAATLAQQLATVHNQLGFKEEHKAQKGELDAKIYNVIEDEQRRQKKKLNYTERQQIIDRMLIEGEVLSGSWYLNDPNRRYYQVYGTQDAKRFAPAISSREREEIEAALRSDGRPVNDKTVFELYEKVNRVPARPRPTGAIGYPNQ